MVPEEDLYHASCGNRHLGCIRRVWQTRHMGAAKIPEEVRDRTEAGLRDIAERRHPLIEKLRALPVERKITPDDPSTRRPVKKQAPRSEKQRRRAMAKEITRLWATGPGRSASPVIRRQMEKMAREIDFLRKLVRDQGKEIDRLREMLKGGVKSSGKRDD